MIPALEPSRRELLRQAAQKFGTPCYVYFLDELSLRAAALRATFGGRFGLSFAIKSNPNSGLLPRLRNIVDGLDASSGGEVRRGLAAGFTAGKLSFSGPAKRPQELQLALANPGLRLVCESPDEMEQLDALAAEAGKTVEILLRINPDRMPRKFGINMAGKPSQFGVDEQDLPGVLARLRQWPRLKLTGFHIYSGTNCLDAAALAENFGIFTALFARAAELADITPERLVFGSGFGVPYFSGEQALDLGELGAQINPVIDAMRSNPRLAKAQCDLELGRWLVAPAGYLLTSVLAEKTSRGTQLRLCDTGFNHHLNACGGMGTVIRRNWPIVHLGADTGAPLQSYTLTGPLCTTFDTLATAIELPLTQRGDVLAIANSGAYGLSASPLRFIDHPEPREILVEDQTLRDVTETRA